MPVGVAAAVFISPARVNLPVCPQKADGNNYSYMIYIN